MQVRCCWSTVAADTGEYLMESTHDLILFERAAGTAIY